MKLLSSVIGVALALAVFSVNAQTKLRYAHVGVANAPQTLYADEVAKLVKERTNGRIEIQVFANSQLGGVNEMVDGVRSGAIAIGHHDFGSLGRSGSGGLPIDKLRGPGRMILHGEQEFEFFKPILVGDTLTGVARVADIYEKEGGRGGKMTFLAVETTYTNQRNEKVALARFVLVETGQAVGG